jgi:hypothetical protein
MRRLIPALILFFLVSPGLLRAEAYTDAKIKKLDGTIMVQKADGSPAFALQTGSVMEKGDVVTCYDQSWVILKDHRGDEIGLYGDTVVGIDELYQEGPDRELRLILQRGTLYLKANDSSSRQSFFEINAGSVVTSLDDSQSIVTYDPAQTHFQVQYIRGKMRVIDKDGEHKLTVEGSIRDWNNNSLVQTGDPDPMDPVQITNFDRFFNGDPLIQPTPTY